MNTKYNIDESIGFLVNLVGRKMHASLEEGLAPLGITPPQWLVLMACMNSKDNKGTTPGEISSRLKLDGAGITRLFDHLEKKELIQRQFGTLDRRSVLIKMTTQGREIAVQSLKIEKKVTGNCIKGIPITNLILLRETLNGILKNIFTNNGK